MENHDLIDRYFEKSLRPKEQKIFNELLQNDLNFKNEFLFQKNLKQVIAANQKEELKSVLSNIEERAKKDSLFASVPKKWLVAASVMIIMGVTTLMLQKTYYPSNEAIYAEYFKADRNTIQPVVRGESLNTIEYRAFVAYEAGAYYKAINLFNSVKNPDATYILYYKGLCYLAVGKSYKAIELLSHVSNEVKTEGTSAELNAKSKWFLALAYLQNNENEKAISQLNLTANNPVSTFKKQEANEILEYLQ